VSRSTFDENADHPVWSPDGQRFLSLRRFESARASKAVNVSDEWPARVRRLLAPRS
jgi:hypothetical protein